LAAREICHEILEARDGELIVAELELVERQLVRLFFGGGAALALAQLVLQLRLRLLELSQAVVEVDVEILLAPLQSLGLIREHLDLPAQLRDVLPQRFDQLGEIDDPVLPGGIQLPSRASIAERRSSIAFWRASTWFFSWKICLRASSSSKSAAWAAPARSAAHSASVILSRIALESV